MPIAIPTAWTLLIELLGLALGLAGVGLSILIYKRQKRDTDANIEEERERLTGISKLTDGLREHVEFLGQTVATRSIGKFPENMKVIGELVARANDSLLIATDVAAYGQLSNPEGFNHYRAELISAKARSVDVQVMTYGGERARREREQQFRRYIVPAVWTSPPILHTEPRWKAFAKRFSIREETSIAEIVQALEYADLMCRRELAASHQMAMYDIRSLQETLPVFFWVRDNHEAVFSLFTVGEQSREISFRTDDRAIIEMLVSIFQKYVASNVAEPFDPHVDLSPYRSLLVPNATNPSEDRVVQEEVKVLHPMSPPTVEAR